MILSHSIVLDVIIHSIIRSWLYVHDSFNSTPPGQNGCHFEDDIFRCIFLNEKFCISIKISLKIVPKGPINNKTVLVWIMAWRRIGDKPLFETMKGSF